jgi:hypothetical protein
MVLELQQSSSPERHFRGGKVRLLRQSSDSGEDNSGRVRIPERAAPAEFGFRRGLLRQEFGFQRGLLRRSSDSGEDCSVGVRIPERAAPAGGRIPKRTSPAEFGSIFKKFHIKQS